MTINISAPMFLISSLIFLLFPNRQTGHGAEDELEHCYVWRNRAICHIMLRRYWP